jgi:hypothetical protein
MPISNIFIALAAVCAVWAVVAAILLARAMEQRGTRTPFLFVGVLVFRNLQRYKEVTRRESGKTGPLFGAYVIPINLAWIFALAAWAVRAS